MGRPTKPCKGCGQPFERHPKYGRAQWERAEFCSNKCRGADLRLERPLCACGCGERVGKLGSRWRRGHAPPRPSKVLWLRATPQPRWHFHDRDGRRVYFSRAVMEAKLGRELRPGEIVHHINADTTDDRPENLRLYASHAEHMRDEYAAGKLIALN